MFESFFVAAPSLLERLIAVFCGQPNLADIRLIFPNRIFTKILCVRGGYEYFSIISMALAARL